jgi:hypothetical protein
MSINIRINQSFITDRILLKTYATLKLWDCSKFTSPLVLIAHDNPSSVSEAAETTAPSNAAGVDAG